jgi:hypothetical protein
MLPTHVRARDHLKHAATILQGSDSHTRQLRYIIERTIVLMDEVPVQPATPTRNVLDFTAFREGRDNLD